MLIWRKENDVMNRFEMNNWCWRTINIEKDLIPISLCQIATVIYWVFSIYGFNYNCDIITLPNNILQYAHTIQIGVCLDVNSIIIITVVP